MTELPQPAGQPTPRRRYVVALVLLIGCVGCDQATKNIATRHLQGEPARSYFGDTLRLDFALNPGGFLSVGHQLPQHIRSWIFVGLNSVIMLVVLGILLFEKSLTKAGFLCLVLILAGGIGNLIDRVLQEGYVTDFINIGIGPLRTGVFNVADIAVTAGGLVAIALSFRGRL